MRWLHVDALGEHGTEDEKHERLDSRSIVRLIVIEAQFACSAFII
jgi:hypothetical protein